MNDKPEVPPGQEKKASKLAAAATVVKGAAVSAVNKATALVGHTYSWTVYLIPFALLVAVGVFGLALFQLHAPHLLPVALKPGVKAAAPAALLSAPMPPVQVVAKTDPAIVAQLQKLDERLVGLSLLVANSKKQQAAATPVEPPATVAPAPAPVPDPHATLEAMKPHKAPSRPKADNESVFAGAMRWWNTK